MSRRLGFTLIELLVVVSIIVILMAVLLPSLGRAKSVANTTKCLGNLRQIMKGTQVYAHENGDFAPYGRAANPYGTRNTWYTNLSPYLTTGLAAIDVTKPATPPGSAAVIAHNAIWQKIFCPVAAAEPLKNPNVLTQGIQRRTYGICIATVMQDQKKKKSFPFSEGYGLQDYDTGVTRKLTDISRPTYALAYSDVNDTEYVYPAMQSRLSWADVLYTLPARHRGGHGAAFVDGHADIVPTKNFMDSDDSIWKMK